jgi:hypothetical protein
VNGIYIRCYYIIAMGIEEGPVLLQMTANVMVQALQTTLEILIEDLNTLTA